MTPNNAKTTKQKKTPPILQITQNVLESIVRTIGNQQAESGGIIGGEGEVITHYHFDEGSRTTAATYSPDHKSLNHLFKTDWNPKNIRLLGFPHSHPGKLGKPSAGDMSYAIRILEAIDDLDRLWLPIVNTVPKTGFFTLTPWVACRTETGVSLLKGRIEILSLSGDAAPESGKAEAMESVPLGIPLDKIVIGKPVAECTPTEEIQDGATFERVEKAYDLNLMNSTRIIAVGAGGAAEWLEQLARAGVGQFVLIDPDVVSETNLATQQTYRKDIGRAKVVCISERIRDINPSADVISVQKKLEELSDERIKDLVFQSIARHAPGKTIVCGLTDSFLAQAQVNRIALHLGIPSLCAQVYKEGRGAEITLTYSGLTPACHRCILSSRYHYYLADHNKNDVTSHGTPIFATTQLNAIKGFVALSIIHHGSNHPRWGKMLSKIGKRNLIQLRMDPDFADTLGMDIFDRTFEGADQQKLFFGEAVWLPQDQECPDTGYPICPDCGGTGDLRVAIGRFKDTRILPTPAIKTKTKKED